MARVSSPRSIRSWIACLVLVTLLPFAILSLGLTWLDHRAETDRTSQRLQEVTRGLAQAVEGELRTHITALQVLAQDPALLANDFDAFQPRMAAFLASQAPGANLMLVRQGGEVIRQVGLAVAAGGPPMRRASTAALEATFATGRPAISDFFIGGLSRRPSYTVEVPVLRDGQVIYNLSLNPYTDGMTSLISRQRVAEGWVVSVFDGQLVNVARTPNSERYVGVRAAESLRRLLEGGAPEGLARTTSLEGTPLLVAWSRVGNLGWTVGIGVPRDTLTAPLWTALWRNLALGTALLVLTLLVALRVGRAIAAPLEALAGIAARPASPRPPLALREAEAAAQALEEATRARDAAAAEAARQDTLLRAIGAAAPNQIFAKDLAGRAIYANPATLAVLGLRWEEVAGRAVDALGQDALRAAEVMAADRRVMETGQAETLDEVFFSQGYGTERLFISSKAPLRDPVTGAVIGVVGVSRDATEERAAQAALAEAEAQARAVLDGMADALLVLDADLRVLRINDGAQRMDGRPAEALLDRPIWEVWPALAGSPVEAMLRRVQATNAPETAEHCYDDPAIGLKLWLAIHVQPIAGGRLAFFYRDITQARQAETALREAEARFRALVSASAQVVWATEAGGLVLEDSPSWRAFTGQTVEQWLGRGWLDVIHPEDRERVADAWQTSIATGTPYDVEYRLAHRAGGHRWTHCHGTPLLDADGRPRAWVGMNTDITERRAAAERQVLLAREVDHRAKNALAVVQALVRMTRAEDVDGFAASVNGRVAALALAHTLLAQEEWTGASLHGLLAAELAPWQAQVALAGPAVRLLPEAVQPMAIALHELASNAARHGALTRPGGRLSIAWEVMACRGLRLRWQESGSIAPPACLAGLGLELVESSLVGQLDGTLAFHAAPDGFGCTLTLSADRLEAGLLPARPPHARGTAGLRVLVAEDEVLIALDLAAMLAAAGCEVIGPVADVSRGMALVDALGTPPDVALLDLNLNGRSVLPLAERLHARGVRLVFITGYGEWPDAARRFPGATVLRKPVTGALLRQTLTQVATV